MARNPPDSGEGGEVQVVELFRPVDPKELELIRQRGFSGFPPRLAGQPIFYPVLNFDYAAKIARDWNTRASGYGAVTRFSVRRSFLDAYDVHQVGGREHVEYWIPAYELETFNANIVGEIEVVAEFWPEEAGAAPA